METSDSRYPYTYAYDFIRGLAGYDAGGTKLSRSDASRVSAGVAAALDMPEDVVARKLADYYKANKVPIDEEATRQLVAALRPCAEQPGIVPYCPKCRSANHMLKHADGNWYCHATHALDDVC